MAEEKLYFAIWGAFSSTPGGRKLEYTEHFVSPSAEDLSDKLKDDLIRRNVASQDSVYAIVSEVKVPGYEILLKKTGK